MDRVAGHKNFMHGYSIEDEEGNLNRVLDYIFGESLHTYIESLQIDFNYRHRENKYGYDIFGLGNILGFWQAWVMCYCWYWRNIVILLWVRYGKKM